MNLSETLELLRMKERESGFLFKHALSLKRNRVNSTFQLVRNSDAVALSAINSKARIKLGTAFIREIFDFFGINGSTNGPDEPVLLVTIADKSHLATDHPQQIQLSLIKRKIGAGLIGLSYIGMIEPGYYNAIYDEFGNQRKNVVSWHGHFIVWGITEKQLRKHLAKIKSRYTPICLGVVLSKKSSSSLSNSGTNSGTY
jgi:hypothetical protein